MSKRTYTVKQLKPLMALTGNQCEFDKCTFNLVHGEIFIGEIAHIKGLNKGSARFDKDVPVEDLNANSNLIVLCPNHHSIIDKDSEGHPSDVLQKMKDSHESRIKDSKKDFNFSDTVIEQVINKIENTQVNFLGSGTQFNSQQIIYNNSSDLERNIQMAKTNVRAAAMAIKRLTREDDKALNCDLELNEITNNALNAINMDRNDLLRICIDEFRKITELALTDQGDLKDGKDYAPLIEDIVFRLYIIGGYAIEQSAYGGIKYMTTLKLYVGNNHSHGWLYYLSSRLYRKYLWDKNELLGHAIKYANEYYTEQFAWNEEEAKTFLMQFEYLGNIFASVDSKSIDFPFSVVYYEEDIILRFMNRIVSEESRMKEVFGGYEPAKIAKSFIFLNQTASQHVGIGWHSDFQAYDSPLKSFIERYVK